MDAGQLAVAVNLVNEKVKFAGTARADAPVTIDYFPPIGDGEGYTSLELLLMSLASCSGTSVLLLLRRMRKTVSGLKVSAKGVRRETHPTCFTKISLEFEVRSADVQDEDVRKALKMSEESICPVWAMLKGNVEIHTEFKIVA